MRIWKMYTYVQGSEYETRETLIDEPTFRQYQKAMVEGADRLILEDRVIKTSSIKEILPADDLIEEYQRQGITLKQLGLKESPALSSGKTEGFKKISSPQQEVVVE